MPNNGLINWKLDYLSPTRNSAYLQAAGCNYQRETPVCFEFWSKPQRLKQLHVPSPKLMATEILHWFQQENRKNSQPCATGLFAR